MPIFTQVTGMYFAYLGQPWYASGYWNNKFYLFVIFYLFIFFIYSYSRAEMRHEQITYCQWNISHENLFTHRNCIERDLIIDYSRLIDYNCILSNNTDVFFYNVTSILSIFFNNIDVFFYVTSILLLLIILSNNIDWCDAPHRELDSESWFSGRKWCRTKYK